MWSCSAIKLEGSACGGGWSEGHCDVTILLQNGHISPKFSLGEDLMVLLCFFLLFVLPKGLIISNDEDHLLKQWLNILFISPGGSRVSWQCCTDQLQPDILLIYLVHHIYLVSQSNKNMHFVLHFMSTGCSSVCPLTWKVFCCSTSCIFWTEPCCVKHYSSWRSFYPQTLYVFCSL